MERDERTDSVGDVQRVQAWIRKSIFNGKSQVGANVVTVAALSP